MKYRLAIVSLLLPALWIWGLQDTPFFWDTVQLASKHAHFFFQNGLQWTSLPTDIDSGHPPVLGYYLALTWTIWGKTLLVSHWAMYPFLVGIVWQTVRLGQYLTDETSGWWLLSVLLLDPVIAGQSALISPDIAVFLGILFVLNGVFGARSGLVMVGGILLCAFSMRGMMTAAALGIWIVWTTPGRFPKRAYKASAVLPGAIVGLLFLVWHQNATGWTGHFEGSSWAGAFERADWRGVLRNTAVLGWRWSDMNRFLLWLALFYGLYQTGWRVFWASHRQLVALLLLFLLFLSPSALMYQNLSAHRYFLPIFVALSLLLFKVIAPLKTNMTRRNMYLVIWTLALAGGHFWVYPRGVSMDWDCTLGHLPYHSLRAKAVAYMDEQGINIPSVGTTFPCLNTQEDLLLNGDMRAPAALNFDQNQWVLASNVLNDIDEPEYEQLARHWVEVQRWEQGAVWMALFRKR